MLMRDQLKKLKDLHYKDPNKVFSMYLNTDPRDPEQQNGKWKIHLKKALNDLAESTKKSESHEEKNQAKTIINKVEQEVLDKEKDMHRGMILFATADEDLWFSKTIHIPVKTEFHWDNASALEQLENLEKSYPYTGIIVVQQYEVLVVETEVGSFIDKTHYTLNLDTDDWREHQGPQGDDLTQGGAKRDEFNERVKANQQRWFKSLVSTLEKKATNKGWKQLYLVGEKDEIEPLKSYFNKNIDKTIPRNLLNWNTSKILEAVLEE